MAENIANFSLFDAGEHKNAFESLVDLCEEHHVLKPLADTYHIWGKLQLKSDKERGKELLGKALNLYQQMEVKGWIKRVEALIAEID